MPVFKAVKEFLPKAVWQYAAFVILCMLLVAFFFALMNLVKPFPSYENKRAESCKAYGEMVKLNVKAVGYDCYVEYEPGKWVEKLYYDLYQRDVYKYGLGR